MLNPELQNYLFTSPDYKNPEQFIAHARAWMNVRGMPLNPVGAGNLKTGGPSTYRPITGARSTCPPGCPLRNEDGTSVCYGTVGRVKLHETNSTDSLDASLNAAAVAMVAGARHGQTARLHVTGDFCRGGQLDVAYVAGLASAAWDIQTHFGVPYLAWSYEHLQGPERFRFNTWRKLLMDSGVVVRMSDHYGPLGAVVLDHAEVNTVAAQTGARLIACPAQAASDHSVTCQTCTLCWTAPKATIVFTPHTAYIAEVQKRASAAATGRPQGATANTSSQTMEEIRA